MDDFNFLDSLNRERIEYLVKTLNEASKAYEQDDVEIMSNFEYDKLYDELVALEKQTGIILAGSPTQKVGFEVISELPKERHESPMLSLDKTKDVETLKSFLGDKTGIMSWKMDGLTNVFTYENGKLVKAVTRGNGEIGEIITNNAKVYKNLPVSIPYKGKLIIRGEAVITYSEFNRINDEIDDVFAKYKNPRNLCSGTVRQLDNSVTASRNVYCYIFALISTDPYIDFKTRSESFEWLNMQGFTCVESRLVESENLDEAVKFFSTKISSNDFPSDGLVMSFDDLAYSKSLGRTAKFPRDSIAFKWKDEISVSKMVGIEWSASRTGLINPVAIFEPVEIEGTTVSRASIHNVSIFESLKLGAGDEVEVYKANMIIPQISSNLTKSNTFSVPTVCPVCGMPTRIIDEAGVRVLMCENKDCLAKKIKAFSLFTSRDAMNIEGLSEATIEKWINKGFLTELSDFYHMDTHHNEIVKMEGFGEKSYSNFIEAIEKSRKVNAFRLLYSLGVPNIGIATAKLIARAFDDDIDAMCFASKEDLVAIDGIGDVIADAYVEFFNNPLSIKTLEDLKKEVTFVKEEKNSNLLEGKIFVITGNVEHFANRDELKLFIENNGGKTTGSVTGKTNYLINNDATSTSSKNKKAKELGVSIITEEEFLKLINK